MGEHKKARSNPRQILAIPATSHPSLIAYQVLCSPKKTTEGILASQRPLSTDPRRLLTPNLDSSTLVLEKSSHRPIDWFGGLGSL